MLERSKLGQFILCDDMESHVVVLVIVHVSSSYPRIVNNGRMSCMVNDKRHEKKFVN
jgi:hypothetical protein